LVPLVAGFGHAFEDAVSVAIHRARISRMSVDVSTNHDELASPRGTDAREKRPRRKRPSVASMLKAAKAAGLEIAAIEVDGSGFKLVCGKHARAGESDDLDIDRRMTEQMGVARLGGRARR
jgi:hypothetical protein